jgi:membrane protein required for colicin V production
MPITYLDFILIGVMLVSALLAMIRGFMREVLSIAAWIIAAVVTLLSYSRATSWAKAQFPSWPEYVVIAAVVGFIFLATLLIVSIITVRFSDMVLDSRVGALDRTLGFLFGLARGLLIIAVAYMFFDWLVPARSQPAWVTNAKSVVVLQATGKWLVSVSPDIEAWYLKYRQRRQETEPQETPAPSGT